MARIHTSPRLVTARRRGHTLWEVLLALALLGLVAASAAPALVDLRRGPRQTDVAAVAHQITLLLTRARLAALERGSSVHVVLDPASGHVWLLESRGDDLRVTAETTLVFGPRVAVLAATPRSVFRFRPTGWATGEAIIVRGDEGERRIDGNSLDGVQRGPAP